MPPASLEGREGGRVGGEGEKREGREGGREKREGREGGKRGRGGRRGREEREEREEREGGVLSSLCTYSLHKKSQPVPSVGTQVCQVIAQQSLVIRLLLISIIGQGLEGVM